MQAPTIQNAITWLNQNKFIQTNYKIKKKNIIIYQLFQIELNGEALYLTIRIDSKIDFSIVHW